MTTVVKYKYLTLFSLSEPRLCCYQLWLWGAHGGVPGLANALPEVVVELFVAAKNGSINEAQVLQQKVSALREVVHQYGPSIPMLHALLYRRGVNAGHPRLPYVLPPKEKVEQVVAAFKNLGVNI